MGAFPGGDPQRNVCRTWLAVSPNPGYLVWLMTDQVVLFDGPAFVVFPEANQNIKLRQLTKRKSARKRDANLWTPSAVSQRADHEGRGQVK